MLDIMTGAIPTVYGIIIMIYMYTTAYGLIYLCRGKPNRKICF
jgi:hypothetical protein